ncbi:MAG: ABC transporter ATP-binding protein/permease [Planctomycetes bacterium]|nr:ABC transporter ATP-binding protein/permease [Planctomycetota bacterium]
MIGKSLKFIRPYVKPFIPRILLGMFMNFMMIFSLLRIVKTIQDTLKALSSITDSMHGEDILIACGIKIIALSFVVAAAGFATRILIIGASWRIEYKLRNDFFEHLMRLSVGNYDKMKVGDIMSRAIEDINEIRLMLGPAIMFLSQAIFIAPIAITYMVFISWKLTILSLMPLLGIVLITFLFGGRMYRTSLKIRNRLGQISSKAQENFTNIKLVKAYAQTEHELEEFSKKSHKYKQTQIYFAKVRGLFHACLGTLSNLGILFFVIFSPGVIISSKLTPGDAFAFFAYQESLIWPMMALGWTTMLIQRGSASVKRFTQVFNDLPNIKQSDNPVKITNMRGEIEFSNVGFEYNHGIEVLTDINLKIPAGSKVGFLGTVGSGKSTIANLIPRIYDVTTGTVKIDGVDVREYDVKQLRKNIGYAPQDSFLFSQSIEKNISFGFDENLSEDKIQEFARVSALDKDEDQFPRGFKTVIGEKGVSLSGGQKQRTALARAIAIDPKILILDDTFSAVDSKTESIILDEIRKILADRTLIIISHRISTINLANTIYVLNDGRIIESGTPSELQELNGVYARIARKQQIQSELEKM